MDFLSAEELYKRLKTRSLGRRAVVLDTVDSTSSEVRRMIAKGSGEGAVVIADLQTGGKGRRGRRWVSEAGCGLWMSFAIKPCIPPEEIQRVTLAAGVAVSKALEAITEGAAKPIIKWPNDILLNSRKLCGILSESQPSPQPLPLASRFRATLPVGIPQLEGGESLRGGASPRSSSPHPPLIRGASASPAASRNARCERDVYVAPQRCDGAATGGIFQFVVVGIGVNTQTPRSGWGEAEGIAISIEEAAGIHVPRMNLASSILNNMEELLDALQAGGFASIAGEYRERMLPPGSEVIVVDGEKRRRGRIEGVEDSGGLLVRLEDGELEHIVSGEITLRGVGGYV